MSADKAIVGVHRTNLDSLGIVGFEELQIRSRQMLYRSLNIGNVVAVIGSGVSACYGYPGWAEFAKEIAVKARACAHHLQRKSNNQDHFEEIIGALSDFIDPKTNDAYAKNIKEKDINVSEITHVLNICDVIARCDNRELSEWATEVMVDAKTKGITPLPDINPLKTIIQDLAIHRFLTINYDEEIEVALNLERAVGSAKELLFDPKKLYQCFNFALAAPNYNCGVFHLHGRYPSADDEPFHGNASGELDVAGAPKTTQNKTKKRNFVPGKLVVSERDYQNLYLNEDPLFRTNHLALNLLFSGNSLLFVGVGLQEDDVLRSLRYLSTHRAPNSPEQNLFALLNSSTPRENLSKFLYYYTRYGVKTIFVENRSGKSAGSKNERLGSNLQIELREVSTGWMKWWSSWREPPIIRVPDSAYSTEAYNIGGTEVGAKKEVGHKFSFRCHHPVRSVKKYPAKDNPAGPIINQIWSNKSDSPIRVICGAPGAGKGNFGVQLARDWPVMQNQTNGQLVKKYTRTFYASTHFSNDLRSIIDAAIAFYSEETASDKSDIFSGSSDNGRNKIPQWDRFKEILLGAGNFLFVLGGVERLLTPIYADRSNVNLFDLDFRPDTQTGSPANYDSRRFFEILNEIGRSKVKEHASVILLSSILPEPLMEKKANKKNVARRAKIVVLPSSGSARANNSVSTDAEFQVLSSLLDGHTYLCAVLSKVRKALLAGDNTCAEWQYWANGIANHLSPLNKQRRAEAAIAKVATFWSNHPDGKNIPIVKLMARVALIPTPVEPEAILSAFQNDLFDQVQTDDRVSNLEILGKHLHFLAKKKLILEIKSSDWKKVDFDSESVNLQDGPRTRFTVHSAVKAYVRKYLGALPGSPPRPKRFEPVDYANEPAEQFPYGARGQDIISKGISNILSEFRTDKKFTDLFMLNRSKLRAAYGLIREGWNATSLSRQLSSRLIPQNGSSQSDYKFYEQYQQQLSDLLTHIRHFGTVSGDAKRGRRDINNDGGILYADELLWLYSELSLCAFCQGYLHDSRAFYRMQGEIAKDIESTPKSRVCQAELNLGIVEIDVGRLKPAAGHLYKAMRIAQDLKLEEILGRIYGYRGLLNHLSSNSAEATSDYKFAIESCAVHRNLRGQAIFLKHKGDLLRKLNRHKKAERALNAALERAEEGQHVELVHAIRIAQAHLRLKSNDLVGAAKLGPTLEFARTVGNLKLEADVYSVQTRVALSQGISSVRRS